MALFIVTLVNLIIGFAALCVFDGHPKDDEKHSL